eukprot:5669771-Pleurochrysis_carterae.AAC.2
MEHCKACGVCLAKVEVENKAHGADPKSLKDLSPPSSPDSLALLKSGKAHAYAGTALDKSLNLQVAGLWIVRSVTRFQVQL